MSLQDQVGTRWWYRDYAGWHGPLTKESADAANEKFGIGADVGFSWDQNVPPPLVEEEWEYEAKMKDGGTSWIGRSNEQHALDAVEAYKWATGNIRVRTHVTNTSGWKVVSVNKNSDTQEESTT